MRLRGSMLGAVVLVAAVALSLSASVAVAATQTYTGDVIRMVVDDYGRPALYAKPSTADGPSDPFVQQYFGGSAWGNVINIYDGETTSTFTSGYGSGTLVTPVSNDIVPAAGGSSVVTVVRLGTTGVQLTQRFTHLTGDRFVTKEWSFTNTSTVTFSRARLYHGGDTYFGNNDAAYGFYDASRKMVYVRNSDFTNWGLMGFYPDPSTLANHYFEGHYSTGNSYANAGTDLPDTVSATYQDAGYYLQWDRGAFAPGQTWSIKAYEVWTPAGALQMLAPGTMPASAGTVANVPFTIQNLSETTMTLTLAPSSDVGWSTSVVGGTSLVLGPVGVVTRNVSVNLPAGAGGEGFVTLTASGDATATASTRLVVSASTSVLRLGTPGVRWIVRRNRPFVVFGALRPRHAPDTKWVRLRFERWTRRGWRHAKTVDAWSYSTGSPSLHYGLWTRLLVRGKYRVAAFHPADADGPDTWTDYNVFWVR
jgi:hypothetical protein